MTINKQLTPYNHTPGRSGKKVVHVVLHTMVGNISSAQSRFMSANGGAAAHYGVGLSGEVRQWVSEGDTAWHAGNWDENLQSIGIEHEDNGNYNDGVRTDALYNSSIELVTDICRRYGLGADAIHIHKEFKATGCPDGLDVARIKNGVAAALAGIRTPAPSTPAPEAVPFTPEGGSVKINSETLFVHSLPSSTSPHGLANTKDGHLHQGDLVSITGWTIGNDPYNDGRNVWLRSVRGNWFWAGGTSYRAHAGQGAPAVTTAAVQPEAITDYTPVNESVTVTGDGLAVRTAPSTSAPLNAANTANGRLAAGTPVTITGYKTGENVSGNAIWLRSQYGNWLWSGGTNFTVPAPAPAAVEAPKAVDAVTEAAPVPQADPDYVATFAPEAKLVVAIDDTEMVDFADQKPNVLVRKGVKVPTIGTFTHEGKEYYRYSSQNAENAAAYFGIPKEDCDTPTQGAVQVPKSIDGIRLPDKVVADADQLLQEVEAAPAASQSLVATIAALFGRIGAALDVPFSIISVLVGKRPSK